MSQETPNPEVVVRPVSGLKPYPNNPRRYAAAGMTPFGLQSVVLALVRREEPGGSERQGQ